MTTATEPSLEQRFKNDLLPQINWETVLNAKGLEPKKKGDHFTTNCPKCGKNECAFYPNEAKGDPRFYCSRREKCGYEEHILAHLNGGQFPNGDDWIKAVQELADLAGLSFELSERKYVGNAAKTNSKNLLKEYWEWLQSRFPNSPAEKYLKGRRLNPSTSPFGYFPEKIDEVLEWAKNKGYSKQELLDCFIIKDKGNGEFPVMYGRLAGAFIDQRGNIHNIWGRDLTGKCEKKYKYLNLDNSELAHKKSPYGADQFKRGSVFWVEGYLDVAASKECGYISVASGTASIPQDMVDSIKGIDTLVIALDKDGAGGEGTFKFIEKNANSELKLYTINHDLMRGCKDIAELHQKYGKDAVDQVFQPDNLEHPFSFAARHILKQNRPENGWSPVAKEKAMEEAAAFDKKVNEPSKMPMLRECFWKNGIEKELELDEVAMDAMLDSMEEKKKQSNLREQIKSNLDKAVEKAKEGDIEGAASEIYLLKEQIEKHKNPYKVIQPYTIFDLEEDLQNTKDGLKTGYEELDEMISIQNQAITLIGGRPSHGKTTLMLNIFLNMVLAYPDMNFYFFSYEETRQQIALKIINILAGHVIQESKNLTQIAGYIKGKHTNLTKINEAKTKYQSLVESGRLKIVGDPFFIQDLSTTISHLSSNESLGAVFIDYIQKIKNKEKFSTRQLELQKTSEIILETAKSASVPIVLGAQLGRDQTSKDKVRLDNLREAGDLEQDANTVLGIYNNSMEKALADQEPLNSRKVDITVTPLKNRNGIVNQPVTLEFDRPILKISSK